MNIILSIFFIPFVFFISSSSCTELSKTSQPFEPTGQPTTYPSFISNVHTPTVFLGTAGDYVVLAKSGISTVPGSKITGDIGVSPIASTAITGFSLTMDASNQFSTSTQLCDTCKAVAASYNAPISDKLTTAVLDMETAYTDAASRINKDASRINLNGGIIGAGGYYGGAIEPLTSGIYTFTTDIAIYEDITIHGSSTDIFIMQTSDNIIMSAYTKIILTGGARAENIFWQIAGLVVVGAGSHMEGIFLGKTKIEFQTGSSINGRILSQTACVLEMTVVNPPVKKSLRG